MFSVKRIQATTGLRQGNPLAPFLFILVGKVLYVRLEIAKDKKIFKGTSFKNGRKSISHLQNADDTILFIKDDVKSILGVEKLLLLFQTMSGISINFHKSQISEVKNNVDKFKPWTNLLGCQVGNIPFTYLGVFIGRSVRSKAFWEPLISLFNNKLAQWKCQSLNLTGRMVLIKSYLDGFPNYWLNLYKIPKVVVSKMVRIRCSFLE